MTTPHKLPSRRRGESDNQRVMALLEVLHNEADKRVQLRTLTEDRWIRDLRQYHGEYDELIKNELLNVRKQNRSTVFMNLTRPKTNALSARLIDLLFPTDDRSWGIQPTPVPEMDATGGQLQDQMDTLKEQQTPPGQGPEIDAPPVTPEAQDTMGRIEAALADLHEMTSEAKRKSDLMQAEIDDQLKAASYQAHCRDAVEDACKLGTGILKGPVLSEKSRMKWQESEGAFNLEHQSDSRPAFVRVDPWSFFPDPYARTVEECEGFLERHLMTKKDLRRMAKRGDMDKDAIRALLAQEPTEPSPSGMSQLFSITNDDAHQLKGKYQVWEYTGPFEPEDLEVLIDVYEDRGLAQEIQGIDPLTEIYAKVWFCQNEVLMFALHPMESNESIYSVFNVERSETGLFGFGIPAIIRDPQGTLNASWRMMMDNGRISSGPQVVVNTDRVEPANNGDMTLSPFKVWLSKGSDADGKPFDVFNINQNLPELERISALSREMIDEMSAMPQIAQGEQGAGITKTAQGMALLMNSANVVFRRMVKNWDDDMTVPNIRRMYDFNMQFSPKNEIKGDYEIDARGSSVLLVREIQSTNLMNIATNFADHPDYRHYIDKSELLTQVFKANMLPTSGIVRSEREAEKERQKEASNQQVDPMAALKREELDLKREELDAKVAMAEMDRDARIQVAKYTYDARMEAVTADMNTKADDRDLRGDQAATQANDRSEAARIAAESKERSQAVEVAMRERTGKSSGGSI